MGIEPATVEDASVVADQWVALAEDQRAHCSHILPTENRETVHDAVLRRIVADELLVARVNDAVVGFVMFTRETGQYAQDVARGIVQNLYVVPESRNRGFGTALLAAAEDALVDSGVDRIALEVMTDNEGARRFYRRHGYEPHRVELEKSVESDTH